MDHYIYINHMNKEIDKDSLNSKELLPTYVPSGTFDSNK